MVVTVHQTHLHRSVYIQSKIYIRFRTGTSPKMNKIVAGVWNSDSVGRSIPGVTQVYQYSVVYHRIEGSVGAIGTSYRPCYLKNIIQTKYMQNGLYTVLIHLDEIKIFYHNFTEFPCLGSYLNPQKLVSLSSEDLAVY